MTKMERIDPWSSQVIEDYEHIFKEFGLMEWTPEWNKELKHYLFERGIIIAHRDFEKVLKRIKEKKPFINITGIASSGRMHLGHKVDIDLFVHFKKFGGKNYFAVSDLDAYCSRDKIITLDEAKGFAVKNLAHALALGLDEKDVYVQSRKETRYYEFTFELSKKITNNEFEAVYGHVNLGKISAALLQYADILHPQLKEFEGKMPSITGIGLDQDPHARLTRDVAQRLQYELEIPSFIYFKHQSGLKEGTKMSSSDPYSAIYLDDELKDAERKIQNALTGGRNTLEEQKRLGGKPEKCKVFEILKFHYPENKGLERVFNECTQGKWLCGNCKKFTAEFICKFLKEHQEKVKQKEKIARKIVLGK